MKSFIKFFFNFFLIFLVIGTIAKTWNLLTEGFRLDKIKKTAFIDYDDNAENIKNILDQPFYYLAKGCQSYVFESKDKKYVIKFFRYHRYRIPLWLKVFDFCKTHKNKRENYKRRLLFESLNSFKFSSKYLKEETGVIFVHLNDKVSKKVILVDKIGNKHLVDLKKTGFIIQKKAKELKRVLHENINNLEELKKLTISFLETTKSIYLKGFNNDDYNCIKNAGFVDGRVIHSDVGSFLPNKLDEKKHFDKELQRFMIHYKKWAKKKCPILLDDIESQMEKISKDL